MHKKFLEEVDLKIFTLSRLLIMRCWTLQECCVQYFEIIKKGGN